MVTSTRAVMCKAASSVAQRMILQQQKYNTHRLAVLSCLEVVTCVAALYGLVMRQASGSRLASVESSYEAMGC